MRASAALAWNTRPPTTVALLMATIDPAALERVLSSIDLRVGGVERRTLDAGDLTVLDTEAVALIYVAEGSVRRTDRDTLAEGDVFFTLGRRAVALHAEHDASLMIAELQFSGSATTFVDALPDSITVTDFARLEPAVAALAGSMGRDREACELRSGDPVICRMMTMTILMTVIRAWAENGCAPAGWPSQSNDEFLDRVVEAIHLQPGREWTVESLASVGAMSRSVFAERFRSSFGSSPASYVTRVRMDTAKGMLDAGQSVSLTARSLGYASDEGFSRAFRRATGVSPSLWRGSRSELISA